MRLEDDGVGPEMRRTTVEGGEDTALCVWKTPLRLVARVGMLVWRDDVDATCSAEAVCDVCARVLVAWSWLSVANSIVHKLDRISDLRVSWACGCHLLLVAARLGRGRRRGSGWAVLVFCRT